MSHRHGALMTWDEAFKEIKNGKRVSRKAWSDGFGIYFVQGTFKDGKPHTSDNYNNRMTFQRDFDPDVADWVWHTYHLNNNWNPSDSEKLETDWMLFG